MITHKLEPGHYVHDLVDGEFSGPWSKGDAHGHARSMVDLGFVAPDELDIVYIADVTVLAETLPKGGE